MVRLVPIENHPIPMVLLVNIHLNHWIDILFYWYQSYHWYQWTIGLTNRIRLCILDMCGEVRSSSGIRIRKIWVCVLKKPKRSSIVNDGNVEEEFSFCRMESDPSQFCFDGRSRTEDLKKFMVVTFNL